MDHPSTTSARGLLRPQPGLNQVAVFRLAASSLAAGAPVRGPRRLALRVRSDRAAAALARASGAPVDVAELRRALDARGHQPVRGDEDGAELLVGDLDERAPRRDARLPEGLGL